jgi:hypothetical protein
MSAAMSAAMGALDCCEFVNMANYAIPCSQQVQRIVAAIACNPPLRTLAPSAPFSPIDPGQNRSRAKSVTAARPCVGFE